MLARMNISDHAGHDEDDLLGVKAGEPGVQRGGVDLEHRDGAERQHHAQQAPIEIAKAEEAAHLAHGWLIRRVGSARPSWDAVVRGDARVSVLRLCLDSRRIDRQ